MTTKTLSQTEIEAIRTRCLAAAEYTKNVVLDDMFALLDVVEESESRCDRAYTDGYNTGKVHATNNYWPSRDYWKAHAEELKDDLERSESSHSLKNALIADLESKRDNYKTRNDALVKAMKAFLPAGELCEMCKSVEIGDDDIPFCNNPGRCDNSSMWEFDVARFTDSQPAEAELEGKAKEAANES